MVVFRERKTGKRYIVMWEGDVREGEDYYYIKSTNVSLPKSEWRKTDETACITRRDKII